ncbi:MAG: hypothetical protein HY762_07250 [Planctomycetes bacterium]|nr:hypothetical protein [Planctomycetota bacterium]
MDNQHANGISANGGAGGTSAQYAGGNGGSGRTYLKYNAKTGPDPVPAATYYFGGTP